MGSAALLSGQAQLAYSSLLPVAAKDYNLLKEKILVQCRLLPSQVVVEFHQWTYQPSLTP